VIDPVLVYSTFLGGISLDQGFDIAVDAAGIAYVTGTTFSLGFPSTVGAFDESYNESRDVFVTKLTADGSGLVYSTFLGGNLLDELPSIVVDAAGSAYVAGHTSSSDFPTTPGAFDESHNGGSDVFVTKLTADGSGLVYSTFLGGSIYDSGRDIAVDAAGSAYVTGPTYSSGFPSTVGAFDESHNGDQDAFVTKLTADGSSLVYSTFLGDSSGDEGRSIAVDAAGNAYVIGQTRSTNFPTTSGAFQTTLGGSDDAFVTKLETDLVISEVSIDIKPGSDPNCINLDSEGVVPAAVLGSATFDVTTINQTTLQLEGSQARIRGKSNNAGSFEDVNGDSFTDLVAHFPTEDLQLTDADTEATLTGTLQDGTLIVGTDAICVVPPASKQRVTSEMPAGFVLAQNYPNPFNPTTAIRFEVPEAVHMRLVIYDVTGREVAQIVDGPMDTGTHTVTWDASGLPSGIYFYQLTAGSFVESRQLVLLK
jgi:hypothetical protein